MAFNGNGTFSQLYNWQTDAANGLNISSKRMQEEAQDMANALSNCLTRDGQGVPSVNLPMNGFKHTGAAPGVADSEYTTMAQMNAVQTALQLQVTAALNTVFPIGMICTWDTSKAAIPSNFALCDGTNGTPDLRGKFILGALGAYPNRATGGETNHVLTVAEMPSHGHGVVDNGHGHAIADSGHAHSTSIPTWSQGGSSAGFVGQGSGGAGTPQSFPTTASATGIGIYASQTGIGISATGGGAAHNNMPPYMALCYVQRMS